MGGHCHDGSIVIGVVGLGMTKAGALEFLSGPSSETLIVRIASLIAQHGVLAAVLAGLILAGILAATMSTADSQMLAARPVSRRTSCRSSAI